VARSKQLRQALAYLNNDLTISIHFSFLTLSLPFGFQPQRFNFLPYSIFQYDIVLVQHWDEGNNRSHPWALG
jgi:hypothetical protein